MKVSECVGCGYCCIKTPCDAARRLYPGVQNCPQLIWVDDTGRYVCGLMLLPEPLGDDYRKQLYAGEGCCSALNSWRSNVRRRIPDLTRTSLNPLPELLQLFIGSLSKQFISSDVMFLTLANLERDLEVRNYEEYEISLIINHIVQLFKSNRSSFNESFIG